MKRNTFGGATQTFQYFLAFFSFRQLQKKYNFIDANHTGIWGWSYGGYAAAMALANDQQGVFRCAASIAPVTDWAYYGKEL